MPYKNEYYIEIEDYLCSIFNIDKKSIPGWQWSAWRKQIKNDLFDPPLCASLSEIKSAMHEAGEKTGWRKAFFLKVAAIIQEKRAYVKPIEHDKGLEKISFSKYGNLTQKSN